MSEIYAAVRFKSSSFTLACQSNFCNYSSGLYSNSMQVLRSFSFRMILMKKEISNCIASAYLPDEMRWVHIMVLPQHGHWYFLDGSCKALLLKNPCKSLQAFYRPAPSFFFAIAWISTPTNSQMSNPPHPYLFSSLTRLSKWLSSQVIDILFELYLFKVRYLLLHLTMDIFVQLNIPWSPLNNLMRLCYHEIQ